MVIHLLTAASTVQTNGMEDLYTGTYDPLNDLQLEFAVWQLCCPTTNMDTSQCYYQNLAKTFALKLQSSNIIDNDIDQNITTKIGFLLEVRPLTSMFLRPPSTSHTSDVLLMTALQSTGLLSPNHQIASHWDKAS